ncbi:MAG: hypothetical protein U1F53_24535 [Burkholderiaceae bacterium]
MNIRQPLFAGALAALAALALAGCDRRPRDVPTPNEPPITTPSPSVTPPASAASQ